MHVCKHSRNSSPLIVHRGVVVIAVAGRYFGSVVMGLFLLIFNNDRVALPKKKVISDMSAPDRAESLVAK